MVLRRPVPWGRYEWPHDFLPIVQKNVGQGMSPSSSGAISAEIQEGRWASNLVQELIRGSAECYQESGD
jgi:hypothetical protein